MRSAAASAAEAAPAAAAAPAPAPVAEAAPATAAAPAPVAEAAPATAAAPAPAVVYTVHPPYLCPRNLAAGYAVPPPATRRTASWGNCNLLKTAGNGLEKSYMPPTIFLDGIPAHLAATGAELRQMALCGGVSGAPSEVRKHATFRDRFAMETSSPCNLRGRKSMCYSDMYL